MGKSKQMVTTRQLLEQINTGFHTLRIQVCGFKCSVHNAMKLVPSLSNPFE